MKVKIKSLAAEARIIRHDERKALAHGRAAAKLQLSSESYDGYHTYSSLREHRISVVRTEARASVLAYAFIRGRPYRSVEPSCHEQPRWPLVQSIIQRFSTMLSGTKVLHPDLVAWYMSAGETVDHTKEREVEHA